MTLKAKTERDRSGFAMQKTNLSLVLAFVALSALTLGSAHADPSSSAIKVGPGQEDQYELIMNKDDKVCKHVQEVLNKDLERYGPYYDRRKFAYPIFKTIEWLPVPGVHYYAGEYARFDIDNDGKQELVVRWTTDINSRELQYVFVFDAKTQVDSLKTVQDLNQKSIGEIHIVRHYEFKYVNPLPRKDWMEESKDYYPSLTSANFIYPFVLNGTTYLLIKDSPDIRLDPALALVALYKQGVVRSADPEEMRDLCYLKKKVRNPTIKRYSP